LDCAVEKEFGLSAVGEDIWGFLQVYSLSFGL
jgi:hypothetical protein